MTARKKAPPARRPSAPRGATQQAIPLRSHAEDALNAYFSSLNGHRPARLYELVLREVELPLFKSVMDYAEGNQSRAATILGINRGTLRKKLREYGLAD
jgi:Fis family transcriptional regulator